MGELRQYYGYLCCAGPCSWATGKIKNREANGHPFLKYNFKKNRGKYSEEDVVTGECLITSKGTGTALEFALTIVRHAKGEEIEKGSSRKYGNLQM